MNILFVSLLPINSNSSAMLRNNALISGLIDNGHTVELLALSETKLDCHRNSLEWDKKLQISLIPDNPLHTSVIKNNNNSNGLMNKGLKFLRILYKNLNIYDRTYYLVKKIKTVRNLVKRNSYDIIISSSDPKTSHILCEMLINEGINYGKWIQYWGDPLTKDITNKSIYSENYLKKKEKKLIEKADEIIYVSPGTLNEQKELFPLKASSMYFLPVPYKVQKNYGHLNKSDRVKIGYLGDYFSNIRDIIPLYSFIYNHNSEKFYLNIIGNSDLILKANANVQIDGRVPHNEIESIEAEADILVCILNRYGQQIPGKLFHYAATDKPILVLFETNTDLNIIEYLKEMGRFILSENEEDKIKEVLHSNIIYKKYLPLENLASNKIAEVFISLANQKDS